MRIAMSDTNGGTAALRHSHVFLGEGHEKSERKTWAVIWLCGAMMIAEIVGGLLFGSIALVADGLHMSTHAGALLLAALAYTYPASTLTIPVSRSAQASSATSPDSRVQLFSP
jgi:Co/Zn/Cd efflux system component